MENDAKNDYELKKQEKEKEREAERKKEQMKRSLQSYTKYALWGLVIVAVGYGLVLLARTAGPDGEDFSVQYDIQGRQHVAQGEAHPPHNSNPPSSGWHYGQTVRGGFYEEQVDDKLVVHNLEHGDIWIAYHPDISDDAKRALESFAGQYVVVSPRTENEGDISLVAWGRVDTFDIENGVVDEQRISDFIKRYDNRGPEKVRGI